MISGRGGCFKMRLNKEKGVVELNENELNIAITAVVELGGPLHIKFAGHLNRSHSEEYKKILDDLNRNKYVYLEAISLLLDAVSVFLEETPRGDFGTYYEDINDEDNVKKFINNLEELSEK